MRCLPYVQVLSVDDEPVNHIVLRAMLGQGYELTEVVSVPCSTVQTLQYRTLCIAVSYEPCAPSKLSTPSKSAHVQGSGEECLEYIADCGKDVPDVILLDVDLPGIDGYEVSTQRVIYTMTGLAAWPDPVRNAP